jgi:acetoacetate decarboxylase
MSKCSFVKTAEEMAFAQDGANAAWMNNCEGLYAAWEADPEVLANVLPAPLKPVLTYVLVYVIEARNPTFSNPYKEAAIMMIVTDGEKMGNYCASLLLTDSDNPVTTGREEFGIPKKNADRIEIRRLGDRAYACVERMGVRLIELDVELGDYNNEAGAKVLGGKTLEEFSDGASYFYKFDIDQDPDCNVLFSNLRLLNVRMRRRFHSWDAGSVKVALQPSINDPWAELAVKRPIGAAWSNFDLGVLGCQQQVAVPQIEEVIPRLIAGRYDSPFYGQMNMIL